MTDIYNPLRFMLRSGKFDDPFIDIVETLKIVNNMVILSEIPDKHNHVVVSGYFEKTKPPLSSTDFMVDYDKCRIFFNESENGKSVWVSYKGKGVAQISADRVYIHASDNPDIFVTIQDLVDGQQTAVDATANLQAIRNDFMMKSTYDNDGSGTVDNAERVGGQTLANLDNRYAPMTEMTNARGSYASLLARLQSNYYDPKSDFGAKGDNSTNDYAAFNNILTAIGSTDATILLNPGIYKISSDITIPSNIALWFSAGAKLSPDSGKKITVNGAIQAGFYQIFTGSGTIDLTKAKLDQVYPEWWGAKGDGTTNDSPAVQKAADTGKNIDFPGIAYYLPTKITIANANATQVRSNLRLMGNGAKIYGDVSLNDYIFSIVGSTTYQTREIEIDGFSVDLKKALGFVSMNGVYQAVIGRNVEVLDSVATSSDNQGSVAFSFQDCFNINFHGRVYKMYANSGVGGVGVRIKSTSGGAYSGNITNIKITDGLIQGCYKNIDVDLAVGADTIVIDNNGLGNSSGGQYAIYVSGSCKSLRILGNHFEYSPTAIYINNGDYSADLQGNTFYNVQNAFDLRGAGKITLHASNEFVGTNQTTKYTIFGQCDATVYCPEPLRYYSNVYDKDIKAGTGTLRNGIRTGSNKTTSFTVLNVEDNVMFTNNGAGGSITATLPSATTVGLGFRVGFNSRFSQTFIIDPDGTDRIFGLTDVAGDAISNSGGSGKYVELVSNGDGTWQPTSVYGVWTDVN